MAYDEWHDRAADAFTTKYSSQMSENNREDLQQRLIRLLLWSILAAMAIYGGSVVVSDLNAVSESIAKLGLVGWVIVLGLSLVNYGLRFVRFMTQKEIRTAPEFPYDYEQELV